MTLKEFRDLLLDVLPGKVYHNKAYKQDNNYLVWREMGTKKLVADDAKAEDCYRIALDYFTKTEYDKVPAELEMMLDENLISYDDVEIIYEQDTGYTHYAWSVEVV